MHDMTLWSNQESAPTRFEMAYQSENSGGWIAAGTSLPPPRQPPVTFARSTRHHPNGSLNPRPDVKRRDC